MRPRVVASLLVVLTLIGLQRSWAEELVTSLSSGMVSIQSNFTGTEIVVFGQVIRDINTISRRGSYELAIVVEGPPQDITTRRKARLAGVWVNRDYEQFQDVPAFYAVTSTIRIGDLADRVALDEHEIGLNHLNLALSGSSGVPLSERDDFRRAFLRLREEQGLYSERHEAVEFLTDTMFRTTIPLPADVPVGNYLVKSFLFQDGVLLSKTEAELSVAKSGFEQFTSEFARDHSLIYGIVAVLLAMFTGWLAGVIFKKD